MSVSDDNLFLLVLKINKRLIVTKSQKVAEAVFCSVS